MFDLFGLPQYAVMAAIVPVSLIYSLVMVLAMYFVARGNFLAFKLSLALMVLVVWLRVFIFFLFASGHYSAPDSNWDFSSAPCWDYYSFSAVSDA